MNAMIHTKIHTTTQSGIVLKALSNWSNVGMSSYFTESQKYDKECNEYDWT